MHMRCGAREAGERVHRDHEQRGPHGFAHGEAAQQRQGGQDDEATTGSEHASDKANPEPRREDARQVGLLRGAEALGRSGAHEHRDASRNHHQRKCCDEYRAGKQGSEPTACERRCHRRDSEREPGTPPDLPGARV
jgi:hypothetical protein